MATMVASGTDRALRREGDRQSRHSWAKTAAATWIRGLRNNRTILRAIVAAGPDEFIRVASEKCAGNGLGLRREDFAFIFTRMERALRRIDAGQPQGGLESIWRQRRN